MRLYAVSGVLDTPCFLLTTKQCKILIDYPLPLKHLTYFLPIPLVYNKRLASLKEPSLDYKNVENVIEYNGRNFIRSNPEFYTLDCDAFDFGSIDVIVISNSQTFLALPYLLQDYPDLKARIYCTEPTSQLGRQLAEEIIIRVNDFDPTMYKSEWKNVNNKVFFSTVRESKNCKSWRPFYDTKALNTALERLTLIGFNETVNIYGCFNITALSSGYSIGSTNWLLETDYHKIGFISRSSSLTTHPKPMNYVKLKNCDALVVTSLNRNPLCDPNGMISEFCITTVKVLQAGGNVLVPVHGTGIVYDLFDCLFSHMESCGLSSVPLYFISPIADQSLAFSNVYGEWLSANKAARTLIPDFPFPHGEMVRMNRLNVFKTIHGDFDKVFKQRCVIFTGHPSLRFGEAVHFLELWRNDSKSAVIFVEPEISYMEALAPFQPLNIKCFSFPLDTSLTFNQCNVLIKQELKPALLISNNMYLVPPVDTPNVNLKLNLEHENISGFKQYDIIKLPLKSNFIKVNIDADLAKSIVPTRLRPSLSICSIFGCLIKQNNVYHIHAATKTIPLTRRRKLDYECVKNYVYGNVTVQTLEAALKKMGFTITKFSPQIGGAKDKYLIVLDGLNRIEFENRNVHVYCDEAIRRTKIKEALLMCLKSL